MPNSHDLRNLLDQIENEMRPDPAPPPASQLDASTASLVKQETIDADRIAAYRAEAQSLYDATSAINTELHKSSYREGFDARAARNTSHVMLSLYMVAHKEMHSSVGGVQDELTKLLVFLEHHPFHEILPDETDPVASLKDAISSAQNLEGFWDWFKNQSPERHMQPTSPPSHSP